ncbi:THAP domain-containing protein 1-like [Harmonia axyridis]|uniref:THAP domain-containing protein 1-like n=1 Tax=Harmonia axyridis TaxID=115357 RepID=UPI001E2779E1|nr:THAP domain-containing protein 1-like [Harmonia axyridis]
MPSSCASYNCVVRFKKESGVKFHRFPKNEVLKQKWVMAMRRKDYKPSATAVICSHHFKTEDYYINDYGTKKLKKGAIPSVFNFPNHLVKKENTRRKLIKDFTENTSPVSTVPNIPNSNLTSTEGSGIIHVEEQLHIPSTSITTVRHELTPLKSETNIRKRKRNPVNVGDFEEKDLECPRKQNKYWNISQTVIKKYRKTNKYLHCKLHRRNKKITDLNSLLDELKSRHHISSETSIILKNKKDLYAWRPEDFPSTIRAICMKLDEKISCYTSLILLEPVVKQVLCMVVTKNSRI